MSETIQLQSFPSNDVDALAMLYVQNQDLSEITPEQLFDMYQEAYKKIDVHKCKDKESSFVCQEIDTSK